MYTHVMKLLFVQLVYIESAVNTQQICNNSCLTNLVKMVKASFLSFFISRCKPHIYINI